MGKKAVIDPDNYIYRYDKLSGKEDSAWRCTVAGCPGRIYTRETGALPYKRPKYLTLTARLNNMFDKFYQKDGPKLELLKKWPIC